MADPRPDGSQKHETPRWVRVSMILGVAAIVLVAVMLLTGHGPWRHFS